MSTVADRDTVSCSDEAAPGKAEDWALGGCEKLCRDWPWEEPLAVFKPEAPESKFTPVRLRWLWLSPDSRLGTSELNQRAISRSA